MTKVANNVAKFVNSNSFKRAEYTDYKEDERTGTVVIDLTDGQTLKIFRVNLWDWLNLYDKTTDDEVHKLTQNHGFCYRK